MLRYIPNMSIDTIWSVVEENCERVAQLGNWPPSIDPKSLLSRIPIGEFPAGGLDAGLACALGLIPEERQKLSATLHAAYTPEAIQQVNDEVQLIRARLPVKEYDTTWWLLACAWNDLSQDFPKATQAQFLGQLRDFYSFTKTGTNVQIAVDALAAYDVMRQSYTLVAGVPWVFVDGGLQGAYFRGYKFGVQVASGIFYVGTCYPSLGLENFNWSDIVDSHGRSLSGPVHGSPQFVKCVDEKELAEVLTIVREKLK